MAMASGAVPPTGVFVTASSSPEWYQHLERNGSCLKLYSLLLEKNELIHELGPKGRTVLHKGVEHACVKLVKFILVDMFDDEGTCTCTVQYGSNVERLTREQLLRQTCEDGISAVHIAVVSGSPKMVLLLKWAIDKTLELERKTVLRKGEGVRRENYNGIRTRSMREKGCEGGAGNRKLGEDVVSKEQSSSSTPTSKSLNMVESASESVKGLGSDLLVPDVKDDSIDGMYEEDMLRKVQEPLAQQIDRLWAVQKENDMIRKVYECIDQILINPQSFGIAQAEIDRLKDEWKKNVDFEFVPDLAQVLVHLIVSAQLNVVIEFVPEHANVFNRLLEFCQYSIVTNILLLIVRACNECDVREGREKGSMVVTLFKILDPRGRTILHAALDNDNGVALTSHIIRLMETKLEIPSEVVRECVNAKDGAGRTILHLLCSHADNHNISNTIQSHSFMFDWEAELSPSFPVELGRLKQWLYPDWDTAWQGHPIFLAVLFNKERLFDLLLKNCKFSMRPMFFEKPGDKSYILGPLQIAAFLGRRRILEIIFQDKTKINDVVDQGLGNDDCSYLPAIHCAALSAQVEGIQSILNSPMYDPIIQYEAQRSYDETEVYGKGTALHLLLQKTNFNHIVKKLQTFTLLHVLPNSSTYAPLKKEFLKLHFDEHEPKDFSANEISCINLLLQAGIDIWTPHSRTKERPNPGPMANDQARRWWYDKVVSEVVTQKTSINNASNATSVIATLVATASFIGPLQPPLGWAGDGYVHTSLISVRVYLVCNILSFYFSIASILMAVLPAIPMPKESLYDELFRSQRCLKTAALLLLVSIICILISFTSASIAVVSSERHDKQLVGASTALGWVVCSAVLVIYIIRLLRMLFHRNNRFRRWFAKNMIF